MNLEKLLAERVIQKILPNNAEAAKMIDYAKRDLKTAQNTLENGDFDWAFAIAYNAMLEAGRALMQRDGYRAFTQNKHVAVVLFVKEVYSNPLSRRLVYVFNKMRKKRHRLVYDERGLVSEEEAENAIRCANEFVERANKLIKNRQRVLPK